ncbi:MAG: glpD [Pedosphaera sp.]|nr:glpD [Pedosphaera sp.]
MKNTFSEQRSAVVKALIQEPLDVLVIGGGIVGSGIARDAAMRGLRVGLVEQHDFAFGTSSRSSRLLHGGLRYLAQGRIGLVREASVEKKTLHHIAPHLAEPLAFIFPTYRGTDWPLWQMRIGVKLYDLLCSGRNLGKSGSMSKEKVLGALPKLNPELLTGAVRYFDGLTNDARLVLDTLRSAANHGASLLNYFKFENSKRDGEMWVCQITDHLTGRVYDVRAKSVVNATGPWADGLPHSRVKLRLAKGIHLVVSRDRLPVPDAVVITEGKRILFLIPWGERVIVGTTDTDYKGSLDKVHADTEDVEYVLRTVNEFFPKVMLSAADIISTWAGLRPLIADPNGKPSDISRAHEIRNPEPGWWDVAGGKLTTYRLMAEQTVDAIIKTSKGAISETAPCRTAKDPLLSPTEMAGVSGVVPPEFNRRAVEHYCKQEWAIHLDDVMVRRTSWHYYHADASQKAECVADWMGDILSWSAAERVAELNRYRAMTDVKVECETPALVKA